MPAFVPNGPDIPASLLQEHENGQVVFFCGAGISMPAGLPGFRGLVEQMYKELGTQRKPIEKESFDNGQYDVTLELLERRYIGGRSKVRSTLTTILTPELRRKNATVTHQALLQLAKDRTGIVRIVTTNFDQIFSHVIDENELDIPILSAPRLPIPKTSRWHGVVHLHGLLPDEPNDTELNRLVLSSSDFGLAYLTERWAARFVSELFRNYTVCFVGYRINDPVLRYMMDALAADRLLGEVIHEAYAFADFKDGNEEKTQVEWEAKGVKPLLYRTPTKQDHSMLHRTLKEWADIYRDGIYGKRMIITQYAGIPPLNSDVPDFGRDLVLWALTDELAAKHFADLNPVPPLGWIESLSKNNFGHDDLSRFGVTPNHIKKDEKLRFSIFHRPTSYDCAPSMSIAGIGRQEKGPWDAVMRHLARWLVRHLNDPKLFLWLLECGGVLNDEFVYLAREKIIRYTQLENENKHEELETIRSNSPNAIPCKAMRTLWNVLLSGRVKASMDNYYLYDWSSRFYQDGLTPILRLELREILAPCVSFRQTFHNLPEEHTDSAEKRIKDYVECSFVLRGSNAHYTFEDIRKNPKWQVALPDLLYDFTGLLHDTLALMRELDCADDKRDLSCFDQQSIDNHPQNNNFREWTVLIELTRDAWIATAKLDSERAHHIVEHWWQIPYPVFKRLVFFAATHSNVISQEQALDWLLSDNHWWLWSKSTLRETIRLVVHLAPGLSEERLNELEQAILTGPPQEISRDNPESEEWSEIVDYKIWLRLSKIEATGVSFGRDAKNKLTELKKKHPEWKLAKDESDEFSIYINIGNGESEPVVPTPKSRRELVNWLKEHPKYDYLQPDDWQQRCRDNFPTTACALFQLSQEKKWLSYRWDQALQEWKNDDFLKRSWRYIASIISKMPDKEMKEIAYSVSWWIENQAKTFTGQEKLFFQLANRILRIEHEGEVCEEDNLIFRAINHPTGRVTQGLLFWWYRQSLKNAEGLRDKIKSLFSEICDTKIEKFRYGRIQLAIHTDFLFQVDQEWTESYLLPLFDWNRSENEARGAWSGFLIAPRWSPLSAIKKEFLETASHYKKLGGCATQYAEFITFLGLNHNATFTHTELARAIDKLPEEGLRHSARTLSHAFEAVEDQKDEYWNNRVLPYIKEIWPKDMKEMDPVISENFGHICLAAGNSFPHAFQELKIFLMPVESSGHLIRDLNKSNLCENFPDDALGFLDAIIGENRRILLEDLKNCLDKIKLANPQLEEDHRFRRLNEICLKGKTS